MTTELNRNSLELPATIGPFDASKPGNLKLMAGDDGHLYLIDEAGGVTRVTLVGPESEALTLLESAIAAGDTDQVLKKTEDGVVFGWPSIPMIVSDTDVVVSSAMATVVSTTEETITVTLPDSSLVHLFSLNGGAIKVVSDSNKRQYLTSSGFYMKSGVNEVPSNDFKTAFGSEWTLRTTTERNWDGIAWSPTLGLFVAVSNGTFPRFNTSPDGINWTVNPNELLSKGWACIEWSEELGIFCAMDGNNNTKHSAISTDGFTWTYSPISALNLAHYAVRWIPELMLFVAVQRGNVLLSGDYGKISTSADGLVWTQVETPSDNGWTDLCWSPELGVVAVIANTGLSTRVMTSTFLRLDE